MNKNNPYIELHMEFRAAGAEVMLSSGQACVIFGIAAFSKDGDWIIRENEVSCKAQIGNYARDFSRLRAEWRKTDSPLTEQHRQLTNQAQILLEVKS